jgi:hypothetical protein
VDPIVGLWLGFIRVGVRVNPKWVHPTSAPPVGGACGLVGAGAHRLRRFPVVEGHHRRELVAGAACAVARVRARQRRRRARLALWRQHPRLPAPPIRERGRALAAAAVRRPGAEHAGTSQSAKAKAKDSMSPNVARHESPARLAAASPAAHPTRPEENPPTPTLQLGRVDLSSPTGLACRRRSRLL